jgi:hypothetical protein
VLGEYLGRLVIESKGRPIYVIDDIYRLGNAINNIPMEANSQNGP